MAIYTAKECICMFRSCVLSFVLLCIVLEYSVSDEENGRGLDGPVKRTESQAMRESIAILVGPSIDVISFPL